jgi:CBS-domain-containing membrane protein
MKNPRIFVIIFAVSAGAIALGIITMVAFLTNLPLVFPPLGASAFILFYTPMSARASPRNVVLSHTMALMFGLLSLAMLAALLQESDVLNPLVMSWSRVGAIVLATGLTSVLMISLKCEHPPAAATALIASMGYIFLLVIEAFLLNRIIGGMPYPRWRYDPKIAEDYRALADLSDNKMTFREQLSKRIFQRR